MAHFVEWLVCVLYCTSCTICSAAKPFYGICGPIKVTHWQRVFIVVVLTYLLRTFRCTITECYITNEGGLIHGYYSYYWLFTTANFQQFFLHFSQVYESPWNAQMHFRRRMLAQTQQTNGLVCMCCKHVASNIIFLNIPNNKRESYSSDKADQICPRILSL